MKEKKNSSEDLMSKIVSLCKRRGFIYQGSEIYGGLAGTWDYGPLGVALKNNIKNLWWEMFVTAREDMYGLDAAILMNRNVWEASGHTGAGFTDPMVECKACHERFRVPAPYDGDEATSQMIEHLEKCPKQEGPPASFERLMEEGEREKQFDSKNFNLMFKTHVGASEDDISLSYLRPETAQGIFTNFKNIVDSFHPKLPFGIAQIGKAFRNEIAPRDFIFRVRELEQMEVEYFVKESDWEKAFNEWQDTMRRWIEAVGIGKERVHELEVPAHDRAHYSKRTIDFEYDFPFGRKELYGLAYRTDYDLKQHMEASKVDLRYRDEESGESSVPYVIEPSLGIERTVLAVLLSAYTEDKLGGEKRVYLKLKPTLAPYRAAVFPLLKNKSNLVEKARTVYTDLKKVIPHVVFDDNGNIGKRYRRQDEIGTPCCITVDFDTFENDTVTLRDRDTGKQERVGIGDLKQKVAML